MNKYHTKTRPNPALKAGWDIRPRLRPCWQSGPDFSPILLILAPGPFQKAGLIFRVCFSPIFLRMRSKCQGARPGSRNGEDSLRNPNPAKTQGKKDVPPGGAATGAFRQGF